ncbi:hypothetical protein DW761_09145 [Absiella sp. AM29-15]|nr:hypothetical protein DW761_09145 [Absiella sp. AM29-15]
MRTSMGKEKSKKTKATVTNLEKKEELNVLAEKEAVNENNESSVSFTNDVFMKFSLIGEDATSNLLRNFFCTVATHYKYKIVHTKVVNSEILPEQFGLKRIVMDVVATDDQGRRHNIEIQNQFKDVDFNRWEFYGARNLSMQLKSGNYYNVIQPEYQIILTFFTGEAAERNNKLINHYVMRNEDGEVEQENALINRTYVNLNVIDRIVEEKGVENLNDFEKLCYLFKHNEPCDTINTGKLVDAIMKKYDDMKQNEEVWTMAQRIEEAELREKYLEETARIKNEEDRKKALKEGREEGLKEGLKEGKKEGLKKGLEEGKKEGLLEGQLKIVKCQIMKKYGQDASTWLSSLTSSQLDKIIELILTCNTYEELKQQIQK